MSSVSQKLDQLLRNYVAHVPTIIAAAVHDHEGLTMASSFKDETDEMVVAACSTMMNVASQKIKDEYSKGTRHLGAVISTETGKFIFTLAGSLAVLTTLAEVTADTDEIQPWTYIVAEKIKQLVELGNANTSIEMPKMTEVQRFNFKMVILGDGAVGKTSLIRRFIDKTFRDDYKSTIGVNLLTKKYQLTKDVSVALNIWDLAGQRMFTSVRTRYLAGAQCGSLIYDVTRRETFESIDVWLKELEDTKKKVRGFAMILVGNKIDLPNRAVTTEEGEAKAKALGIPYIETSAKSGENVDKTFASLCYILIKDSIK